MGPREARIIESEVLFYLGNAYTGLGENELALRCFNRFIDHTRALSIRDAEHHGIFFVLKCELKKKALTELSDAECEFFLDRLNILRFTSASNSSVSQEVSLYRSAMNFITTLNINKAQALVKVLPEVEGKAMEFIDRCRVVHRELLSVPSVAVVGQPQQQAEVESICSQLREIGSQPARVTITSEVFPLPNLSKYDLSILLIQEPMAAAALLGHLSNKYLISLLPSDHPIRRSGTFPNVAFAEKLDEFIGVFRVTYAFMLCRRLLDQDRYIFALSPCVESPALEYQRAKYDLALLGL
jgi:hypothetical protein